MDDPRARVDVTDHHLFVGYKPVIIALVLPDMLSKLEKTKDVWLEFCHGENVIASLWLRKDRVTIIGSTPIVFYQALRGRHSFISPFHQLVNRLKQGFSKHNPDNVSLDGNLYEQVRIAYCMPRVIGVITVGTSQRMNMFPTDLHGIVSEDFYVSSLRIGGAVTQQVEHNGKMALSMVPASAFRQVYALGPNHMREPVSQSTFACSGESRNFQIPLPSYAVSYLELALLSSIEIGIHRIHIYRIVSTHQLVHVDSTLAHIHSHYAQWRIDRNIPTQMLIR